MRLQLHMYSKYLTPGGRLSKQNIFRRKIKDRAAGMGEKTLEGKALQQIRPELQWDIAGKHKHAPDPLPALAVWRL